MQYSDSTQTDSMPCHATFWMPSDTREYLSIYKYVWCGSAREEYMQLLALENLVTHTHIPPEEMLT